MRGPWCVTPAWTPAAVEGRLRHIYNRQMSASTDPRRLRSLSIALRDFVLSAKRGLDEEIRGYPTPIPRCDAQFNAAYEQRSRLAALLPRLDAAVEGGGDAERLSALAEFSALPSLGEGSDERSLRASITAELSNAGAGARQDSSAADLGAGSR
jgi:hypothetical protein